MIEFTQFMYYVHACIAITALAYSCFAVHSKLHASRCCGNVIGKHQLIRNCITAMLCLQMQANSAFDNHDDD
jgi:hypothetical protein